MKKLKRFLNLFSEHPWDWLIHTVLCFIPVYLGWAVWPVVAFVSILVEYEQGIIPAQTLLLHISGVRLWVTWLLMQ